MPYLHVTSYYGRCNTHHTNFTYVGDAWNEWEDSKGQLKGYFFVLTKLYDFFVADDGLSMYMWNKDTGEIEYEAFLSEYPTPAVVRPDHVWMRVPVDMIGWEIRDGS